VGQQVGEVGAAGRLAPVVDRLAEELDLEEAVVDQMAHLMYHLGERSAALRAAGLGHDAEGADLVAPLDDRDHPLVLALAGDRIDVVAPLLGKAGRHHPAPGPPLGDHPPQLPHSRRPDHEVQVGHPPERALPLLLGHAATQADQQQLVLLLELAVLAEARVDLLLGLLPDAAGVEEDDVGLVGRTRRQHPLLHELAGQALAVQLVHLAAPSLDEEAAGLRSRRGAAHPSPSSSSSPPIGSRGSG
jgi:hypothetical protein